MQLAPPHRPIDRGPAGPGLLACVLVEKIQITCRCADIGDLRTEGVDRSTSVGRVAVQRRNWTR